MVTVTAGWTNSDASAETGTNPGPGAGVDTGTRPGGDPWRGTLR
jgi:hypothetical protein